LRILLVDLKEEGVIFFIGPPFLVVVFFVQIDEFFELVVPDFFGGLKIVAFGFNIVEETIFVGEYDLFRLRRTEDLFMLQAHS